MLSLMTLLTQLHCSNQNNKVKMKSLKRYIFEASAAGKNTHMTHIEDLVLYGGADGVQQAISSLKSLTASMSGGESSSSVTVKWDGAPAVFAGQHPETGKFFVAKKGIFNKDPKVYTSVEEVKADTSGDLQAKMIVAFNELQKLGIKGIIQGDMMFTHDDLKTETIDGKKYVTFHPNTIVYAVPVESAEDILKAKIGVVFHTQYTGKTFDSLKATYKVDTSSFKKIPSVWWRTADLKNVSKQASLSVADTKKLQSYIASAEQTFKKIKPTALAAIYGDPDLAQKLEQFNNTFVRKGETLPSSDKMVAALIKWMSDRFEKDIESKKSDKGKEQARDKMQKAMSFFSDDNRKNLQLIYDLQSALVNAKKMVIAQLDRIAELSTFVKTKDGFKVTGQEGYVAISTDLGSQSAVKLVDRLEFSKNNFSSEILKGWQRNEVSEEIDFKDMQRIDPTGGSWNDSSGYIAKKYRDRRISSSVMGEEEKELEEDIGFIVKYAVGRTSKIYQQEFDNIEDAKEFLDSVKKKGMNGIISTVKSLNKSSTK